MKRLPFVFATSLLLCAIVFSAHLTSKKEGEIKSAPPMAQATVCMQDVSNGNTFQLDPNNGAYTFTRCTDSITVSGVGTVTLRGSVITLQHNTSDRRVLATVDTIAKTGTASVQLLALGKMFTVTDKHLSANACNSVTWSPQQLELTLAPGESTSKDVTFTVSTKIPSAVLVPSASISNFVSVEPATFTNVQAGVSNAVRVSFAVPLSTALKTYEGTIQVKTQGCNLLQTLNIVLTVSGGGDFRAVPEVRPTSGTAPLTVTFITKAIYTTGAILRYRWDFQGDGIFDTSDPGARNYTRTYAQKGVFNAVLEVLNDRNQIATATIPITVTGKPPTATAGVLPSNGAVPLNVAFSGSGTDPDGTIIRFEWDFEGDGIFDFTSATTGNTSHMYKAQGTFNALLRVTDNDGMTATAPVTIRVGPAGSPTARITTPAAPLTITAPFTVSFNGTGTDANGTITKFEWDFNGDGIFDYSSATSAATTFNYQSPGTYTASFRVTDNSGLTGMDTVTIKVNMLINLNLSNDTCRPMQGGTLNVLTSQSGVAPVTIFIRNPAGQTVRTLVNNASRQPGSYSDTWDCLDNAGQPAQEGLYYAVLQYLANGQPQVLDASTTTGGQLFNPDWTMSTSSGSSCFNCPFKPFEDNFLKVDFSLPQAAEVSVSIRLFNSVDEVAPLFDRKLFGRGNFTLFWDGTDVTGKVVAPPPGEQLLWGMTAFTLPTNGIFVEAAPQVSDVSVDPNYFDPATGNFLSPQSPSAKVTYTLSKSATVLLQVYRTGTNRLIRTISQANVPAGTMTVEWDGKNQGGMFVDKGDYHLALKAVDAAGNQSIVRYLLVRVFY